MKDINFLRKGMGDGRSFANQTNNSRTPLLIIVLLLLLSAVVKMTLMQQVSAIEKDISEKEAFVSENSIVFELENNINDYNVQLNKTKDLLSRLAKANTKNSEVFETLGKGIPNALYMASYQFTEDKKILVSGYSPSKEDVAHFTWSLQELKIFKNVYLDSVTRETKADNSGERFKYQFTVEL